MDASEVPVLFFSGILALAVWGAWYYALFTLRCSWRIPGIRAVLGLAPVLASFSVWIVLRLYSAQDVRDDLMYLLFYSVMGAAWVGTVSLVFPFANLQMREDALYRGNPSAAIATAGALIGVALAFAGANIGDGPGWWVVLFSGLLPTLGLFVAWQVLHRISAISDRITIDRDPAAGWRAGGFWIGTGAILGRAAAGDWIGYGQTVQDFLLFGSRSLLFIAVAVFVEKVFRPGPAEPHSPEISHGILPGLGMALLGGCVVLAQGWW